MSLATATRLAGLFLALASLLPLPAQAVDYDNPLKLGKTDFRTNTRDRSHDPQDELVYKSNGPVLDERHLQRNQTGRTDGKVHGVLESIGESRYRLTLQSLDNGRLKEFDARLQLVLPAKASCRFGYWTLGDPELEENTLTDSPDYPYYSVGGGGGFGGIQIHVDQASGRSFHFTGGRLVISFRAYEACV